MKIDVLDHGFVRLVDKMGDDLSVVRAARVSYDAAWRAGENEQSDRKLINYLWKNKHTTPFEAVVFTFEVKAPIFVLRQWHRHRTWSYNELSGRYKELDCEFYVPSVNNIGEQSKNNKQGREVHQDQPDRSVDLHQLNLTCGAAGDTYRTLLRRGWPRELARMVLPLNTYSHMFCTVNLLNLFKFLTLRNDDHAQYEIREYAKVLEELIAPVVPVCYEAYRGNRIK